MRRSVQHALLRVVLTSTLVSSGCRNASEPFATSRAFLSGRVTRGQLAQPVAGLQLAVEVPLSTDCTVMARLSPSLNSAAVTDTNGRYAVEVSLHGIDSVDLCVIVSAEGTSVRRTPVRFREIHDGAADTVAVDIQLP